MHRLLRRVPRLHMLAVFESAARLGTFTAAAHELGMTQPGVSRQIAALERAIGITLFDRTGNRATLTAQGRDLLTAIQSAFDEIGSALDRTDDAGFLLAANPGFAQQWLLPNLDRLQDVVGEVELRVRLFDRDDELTTEPFDVAVHLAPIEGGPPGSRVLFGERVLPVASPAFATAHGLRADTTPSRLLDVPMLHLDGRDRQWMTWSDWFAGHDVAPVDQPVKLTYNNYAVVMAEAAVGAGVALAWRGLVDPALADGSLVPVGPELHRPTMAYQLIPGREGTTEVLDRLAEWLATV